MKALMIACALTALAATARAEALLTVPSTHTVPETIDRIEAAAKAGGFFIVARVDHSAAAAGAGLALRPTTLLVFGKPQGGTPIMQCDQRSGIDLPLRALSWQDEAGKVWLAMADPAMLKTRYDLGASCDAPVAAMQGVVRGLLEAGAR